MSTLHDELEFNLEIIDRRPFEQFGMAFLRALGYEVHESGASGPDGGWDRRVKLGEREGIVHMSTANRWKQKLRKDAESVRFDSVLLALLSVIIRFGSLEYTSFRIVDDRYLLFFIRGSDNFCDPFPFGVCSSSACLDIPVFVDEEEVSVVWQPTVFLRGPAFYSRR
ncbi:hypothetical protein RBH26_09695 [Natronolimnohabitans sp. A-GB9]|uniref:hypothetical protein n=1 Tax=Natronolimnohabitans sp. A-GB9 TaxID=3069757 RepID=UPI0027B84426|nr:hypothetical protein [Natronolimnohabitans sp. A-GB9]MDQ2050759.1 hypothetical protein [Natronolimnohabitans sp. A-GB9]